MTYRLSWGTVRNSKRTAIHVVRVHGKILGLPGIDEIAERMRERLHSRGEIAEVVVAQGSSNAAPRLFGAPYAVTRVRAALFNAAVSWTPIDLD